MTESDISIKSSGSLIWRQQLPVNNHMSLGFRRRMSEEQTVSLVDVLEEDEELEEEASAVLAGSDSDHCSYPQVSAPSCAATCYCGTVVQ